MAKTKSSSREEEVITELEITPLVAVALVLVMIFMVTAPLLMQPTMKVTLPKAVTGEAEERENVTISISEEGKWAVNEIELPFEDIRSLLLEKIKRSRDKYVVIRADQQALHKWLLEAMSVSKGCEARTISIKVDRKIER